MEQVAMHKHYYITFFPGADDVWFSLRNTTYQNYSCATLEDIGEGSDALLCRRNESACCIPPCTGNESTLEETGSFPMELEFPVRLLIKHLESSGMSTEPEVAVW